MELITAIALLCQISAGGEVGTVVHTTKRVDNTQLECQKYYVNCIKDLDMTLPSQLAKCIKERKP